MFRTLLAFMVAAFVVVAFLTGSAFAQTAANDDPVVASVNGTPIYNSEVRAIYDALPASVQNVPFNAIFLRIRDRLVERKIVALAARREGLHNEAVVRRAMDSAREEVLEGTYLQRLQDGLETEDKLVAAYEIMKASYAKQEEIRARHVLLTSRKEALAVLEKIKGGLDFAEAAKTHSTGPTGPNGGDLGYFQKAQMVEPFANAAFSMKAGEVSAVPVQTRFGWHLIKVEDRRAQKAPSFAESRNALQAQVAEGLRGEIVSGLKGKAEVRVYNSDGSP